MLTLSGIWSDHSTPLFMVMDFDFNYYINTANYGIVEARFSTFSLTKIQFLESDKLLVSA